jgi:hypothetical protein
MTAGALLVVLERSRPRAYAHSWRVAELAARLGADLDLISVGLPPCTLGPSSTTSASSSCRQRFWRSRQH